MKTATNGKTKTAPKPDGRRSRPERDGRSGRLTDVKSPTYRATKAAKQARQLVIQAPNMETVILHIRGTTPYVQNKFSGRIRDEIAAAQAEGTKLAKAGKAKKPKDFQRLYRECQHIEREKGWNGIPAKAFRDAMIDACRLVDFKMVMARITIWVEAEGYSHENAGLVRIRKVKPEYFQTPVRNTGGGMDIRARAQFPVGWEVAVKVRFNADVFQAEDIANLMMHAGQCVGVGDGRDLSPKSNGMGWGNWELLDHEEACK